MAEKLGEIGEVFTSISESVKTAKALQDKRNAMARTVEEAIMYANDVEKLEIPDEPLLDDLKRASKTVRESGAALEESQKKYLEEGRLFDKSVEGKFKKKDASNCNSLSPEIVTEFCDDLKKMTDVTKDFCRAFEEFTQSLSKAQQMAIELTNKLKEMEKQQKANIRSTKVTRGILVTGLTGAGLVALGFFTGGAGWVAGAAVGASFLSAGAAVAVRTFLDIKKMNALAAGILKDANSLDAVAKKLKNSCDDAAKLKLDPKAIEHLETALTYYRNDQEKNEALAEKDRMLEVERQRNADQEAKMREMEAECEAERQRVADKEKALAEREARMKELEARYQQSSLLE